MEIEYLTVKEVAERFRLSEQAIYKIIDRDKDFPVIKVGGSWRFDLKKINEYFENRADRRFNNAKTD